MTYVPRGMRAFDNVMETVRPHMTEEQWTAVEIIRAVYRLTGTIIPLPFPLFMFFSELTNYGDNVLYTVDVSIGTAENKVHRITLSYADGFWMKKLVGRMGIKFSSWPRRNVSTLTGKKEGES